MTYSIGGHTIDLDHTLTSSEEEVIIKFRSLYKICLNNASLKLLINVKRNIHLYSDIIMIYSTLLTKIPNYEDIRTMALNCKHDAMILEDKFNEVLSPAYDEGAIFAHKRHWVNKRYESVIKPLTNNLLTLTARFFDKMVKTLTCIQLFFESFNNLKKLLIPFILDKTRLIINAIKKLIYFLNFTTIADQLISIDQLSPTILKQVKKIEKITHGIERETVILDDIFNTLDPTLQIYTASLLGKAILKRDISMEECKLINRREICYQATEHVVSIPLTEDQKFQFYSKYLTISVFLFVLLMMSTIIRLFKVIFS